MRVSLIVAMAANRVIGRGNALPWRLPADLKRFKQLTMGKAIIMGRRTWESIGRPLSGRTMIVVTRRGDYAPQGVLVTPSLDEALGLAAGAPGSGDEAFVIGGAEIFREALPRAGRLYLTRIDADFEGDVLFPEFNEAEWTLVSEERHEPGESGSGEPPFAYTFLTYDRKRPA